MRNASVDEYSPMSGEDHDGRYEPIVETEFSRLFRSCTTDVSSEMRIHYMVGGTGTPVVLLHAFPQYWREWRRVMLALANAGYAVMAPDLRGFGGSDTPLQGFDVGTVGDDVRHAVRERAWPRVNLVGHDLGASVAYAWAAAHPDEVARLVLMEVFPAGLEPPSSATPAADHELDEAMIRQSRLDWVIIRPPMLTNGPQTGTYRAGERIETKALVPRIARADVAEFMLKQLTDDTFVHASPTVIY